MSKAANALSHRDTRCATSVHGRNGDPSKPIASAFGHFMLRRTPDVDEE